MRLYLDKKRINTKFLPGIKIPRQIMITHDLNAVVDERDLIIFAIPRSICAAFLEN